MTIRSFLKIKEDFTYELEYLSRIGTAVFVNPFVDKSKLLTILFCLINLLTILTATQLTVTLCLKNLTDLLEIVDIMPNLAVVLMSVLKYMSIHVYRHVYQEIFFHFRNIFQNLEPDNQNHLNIVAKFTRISKFLKRLIFYYSVLLIIFIGSFPRIFMYYTNNSIGMDPQYLYPFEGWYPFDNVAWYNLVYIWECLMTSIVIFIYVFVNMTNVSFTTYICMELKVIGNDLENLIGPEDVLKIRHGGQVKETHFFIRKKLRKIIMQHQTLAKIAKDFDNILGIVFLITHLYSSVFICLTIFTATVVDNLYKSLRYFFMCCSMLIDIFLQCVLGQILSDHSSELSNAIYFADWPYADKDTKLMLLIFMTRTRKPFQYTARGFVVMNLDTFSAVCSLSYQMFNLLRTAYC
ncbi:hypothetical protein ACJJTC_004471 [Scirpophaga incertulas]